MSQFYARYVPPKKVESIQNGAEAQLQKRKHSEITEKPSQPSSTKRQRVTDVSPTKDILQKYSISKFARDNGASDVTIRKRKGSRNSQVEDEDKLEVEKHKSVLTKYGKSRARSDLREENVTNDDEEIDHAKQSNGVKAQGLEPIPQPEVITDLPTAPSFSTLSQWQSNAIAVDGTAKRSMATLGLSTELVAGLKSKGITNAFPIQSTIIPLLCRNFQESRNDLCVSAATGSGKTLAYIVPIVEALRRSSGRGLKAVIVVPTRDLVKQVRSTCETCIAGSSIHVATATGNRSMREESESLVAEEQIYDPVEYERRRNSAIDWDEFDLLTELDKLGSKTTRPMNGHVIRRYIKADVLITTPGRLVDHLKNTEGFHLDDVEWLVVDEADKLLNESYQEWIEAVIPALKSRNATKQRDQMLLSMNMKPPPRYVRKVLLSATMTRDISKLNALELNDPKLVVLAPTHIAQPAHDAPSQDTNKDTMDLDFREVDQYQIPASLHETALAFKDGADRPLILLNLLQDKLQILSSSRNSSTDQQRAQGPRRPNKSLSEHMSSSSDSSDSNSTNSDTDTDTDSGSESDDQDSSDSDTSSTTSSRSSSLSSSSSDSDESSTVSSAEDDSDRTRDLKHEPMGARALVFTKSTAAAARLSRLLSLLAPQLTSRIAILSRAVSSSASSRKALASFRSGKLSILVATDRASRGIDVPGLEHVVNYDIPGSALVYVHRVGRTARAGAEGHSWTLVEHREGRWFWQEIGGKGDDCKIVRATRVQKLDSRVDDEMLRKQYEDALQTLGEEVKAQ